MQLDNKAKLYLKKAKDSGISREDAFSVLQSKGYELGEVKEPFVPQPLTEEQKLQGEQTAQQYGSDTPIRDELGRGAVNIARDVGAVLPFEGLQEKGEALLKGGDYATNLANIKQDKAVWDLEKNRTLKSVGLPTWTDEALEVVAGISTDVAAGNTLGITNKLAKMSPMALRGINALIGATEAGTLSNTPLGYAIGGTLGLIAPDLAKLGIKGIKKGSGLISDTAGDVVGKLLKQTGGKDITDIASNDKTMAQVIRGIDSSKETAKIYREVADKALEDTYDRTQRQVSKALGVDDVAELGVKAKKQYADTFAKVKNKTLKADVYENPVLKDALGSARKNDLTGELANLDDNTLGMAQSVKEVLDDKIAKSYVSKGLAQPQATKETRQLMQIKNDFVKKLDNVAPEYKKVRADYGKWKQSQNLIDDIMKPRGKEGSNLSSMLLTNKNKTVIKETLGQDKLNNFVKTLREEDNIYKNVKSISTKARNRVQERGSLKTLGSGLKKKELIAPILLGGATGSPAVGAGVLGAEILGGIGTDIYRGGVARGLTQGTQQLDPLVQAIMARQSGGLFGGQQ